MKPSDPISASSSFGTLPCSSISRARGSTFSRAKSRAVRWTSSCSSLRVRSKPVTVSVVVAMSVPMLLIRVEADVAPVGVASVEVVALERSDRAAGFLRARKGAGDVIAPEPDDEAALCAYLGLGLTIVRVVDDDLRVFRLESGLAALEVRLEPGDLGVESNDFRAPRSECHHRADAG